MKKVGIQAPTIEMIVWSGFNFPPAAVYSGAALNTWYNVAVKSNGTDHRLYVNGSYVNSVSNTVNRPALTHLLVGDGSNPTYGYVFGWDGPIDEMYIWNTQLSDAAISALYNAGAGKFYSP